MDILGITKQQVEVLKLSKLGHSYTDISHKLDIPVYHVIYLEEKALTVLARRWRMNESKVRSMINSMLLVILVLMPLLEMKTYNRLPVRGNGRTGSQFVRGGRGGRSGREFDGVLS